MQIRLLAILMVLVMAGCASVPESIQVAENVELVDYQAVSKDPDGNREKVARWGGVIAKVENLPEATMVEVVHFPLKSWGRPVQLNQSVGRFRVYVDGFLDPVIYKEGKSMTFSGVVAGVEDGNVGEQTYVFPTLKADGYHLWQDQERIEVSGLYIWPHPFYHNYNLAWHHHHYRYRYSVRSGPASHGSKVNSHASSSDHRNSGRMGSNNTSPRHVEVSASRREREH